MNKPTSGEDLLILARRGELSEAEQRRLEIYLDASPLSHALYELGVHYDSLAQAQQHDSQTIERAITAVCEREKRPAQRRRRRGWLIGIVAALSSVSAAATAVTVSHWIARAPASSSAATPSAGSRAFGQRTLTARQANSPGVASPTAEPPDTAQSAVQIQDDPPSERARPSSSRAAEPGSARPADVPGTSHRAESAAQMFSEANALRKAGRLGEAEQAYRRLQQAYAGSPEAAVSHVLLGRILLRAGRAAAACVEFERYLGGQSRGNLAEEALQGDAMCARALGRTSAERAVWHTLLARFPGSIYADAARQRLKDLDSTDGPLP